jgi:large subunit ribosomal protein L17
LSRTSEHRIALRRNLAISLLDHETISTTIRKAKEVKGFVEKLITLSKKGTLAARRRAISFIGNPDLYSEEDGQLVKKGTIIGKLFSELGPRYLDRTGGYTRIIHLSKRRLGDNGELVLLQLIGAKDLKKPKSEKGKKSKTEKEENVDKLEKMAPANT